MIKYIIKGRLGNQLFIYAFARANYEKNKIPYCFNYLGKLTYFQLTFQDLYLNLFKKLYFRLFLENKNNTVLINANNCWLDHSNLEFNPNFNYVVSGYFQGEIYFKNIKNQISKYFTIRSQYIKSYLKAINNIKPNVSVHIRRGDYNHVEGTNNIGGPVLTLPKSYYEIAINMFAIHNNIFFLSDDIDLVKRWFGHMPNTSFTFNSEIVDFQIIMNSTICIISNSTFSWWASWLNSNENKIIIAPKYFLGFKIKKEFPINILPDNWYHVEVTNE